MCGSLGYYDVAKEKKISLKSPLPLQSCDHIFHTVTTTDDPIIRRVGQGGRGGRGGGGEKTLQLTNGHIFHNHLQTFDVKLFMEEDFLRNFTSRAFIKMYDECDHFSHVRVFVYYMELFLTSMTGSSVLSLIFPLCLPLPPTPPPPPLSLIADQESRVQ